MNFIKNIIAKVQYDSELKEDIYKIGIMLTVSRAFKDGDLKGLDNKKFLTETFATLAGFAVYHLIIKDYALKIQMPKAELNKIAQIAIKVGSVLIVSKLIKGKELDAYSGSYIISGFLADALFKDCLNLSAFFEDDRLKRVADDFILAAMTTLVPRIVKGGRITSRLLKEVVAKTIGFAAYTFLLA